MRMQCGFFFQQHKQMDRSHLSFKKTHSLHELVFFFVEKAREWQEWQMTEVVGKHDERENELLDQISMLERSLLNEQQKTSYWRSKNQELPALPKQQKENRLRKFKQLVSKVKDKTKEKFQTFIVQKNN